jgi:hypothetical protein
LWAAKDDGLPRGLYNSCVHTTTQLLSTFFGDLRRQFELPVNWCTRYFMSWYRRDQKAN